MNLLAKTFLLSILLFILAASVSAQDIIYLKDGSAVKGKIEEVGPSEIKYHSPDNPDGPLFTIKKNTVLLLAFENGSHESFVSDSKIKVKPQLTTKNLFTVHLFDVVFNTFTISYERISKSGMVGFRIPLSVGYADTNPYEYNRLIGTGLTLNFYPTGQGKWRYFLGPDFQFGLGENQDYYYWDGDDYVDTPQEQFFYARLLIDNGVIFSPINTLSLAAYIGLGVRYADVQDPSSSNEYYYYSEYDKFGTDFQFSFNLSYRFGTK